MAGYTKRQAAGSKGAYCLKTKRRFEVYKGRRAKDDKYKACEWWDVARQSGCPWAMKERPKKCSTGWKKKFRSQR